MDNKPQPTEDDDRTAIKFGIVVMLFLLLIMSAIQAFAAQPAADAPQSEHLYFIAHLLVVIFAFLFCLMGAVHGYSFGAKNDGSGG
jgi:ABC-type uncharacterized transport system permease subunit